MYESDIIKSNSGQDMKFAFYGHASLAIGFEGKVIYIDPVSAFADYSAQPKADVILVTHQHDDHLDTELISALRKEGTVIISTPTVAEIYGPEVTALRNGERTTVGDYLQVEAIPAYNTNPERQGFHPHTGRDNGYLLTMGGSRIYVAGDGENTTQMMAMRDIDVAFLPVNQPYTMTVDQAAEAALAIGPKIFYPYHYGQTDTKTDIALLVEKLQGSGIEVRVRRME